MSDKEWYADKKVGEAFTMEDGTPVRKVGPDWQEKAQALLDAHYPGLKIVRDPVDGRFVVDNKEELLRQVKIKFPDI